MSKRPPIDMMALTALTSEKAAPMPEAAQRSVATEKPRKESSAPSKQNARTLTYDLEPLSFKVPPAFDKRFRRCAFDADLKLNELLFEALDAWEEKGRQ